MRFFNLYGFLIFVFMMIPNLIYFKSASGNNDFSFKNKKLETMENIGRYGSFLTLIFNIPYTWFGFFVSNGVTIYYVVNGILLFIYLITWVIMWKSDNLARALILSIVPSLIFLFSGVMIRSVLLMIFSLIFSIFHIIISVDIFLK